MRIHAGRSLESRPRENMVRVNIVFHDATCECFEGNMLEPCVLQPCFLDFARRGCALSLLLLVVVLSLLSIIIISSSSSSRRCLLQPLVLLVYKYY